MTKQSVAGEQFEELDYCVPLLPVSVNHYVRHTRKGIHYQTAEAKAFKNAVSICCGRRYVRFPYYAVEIYVTLGPKQKIDLDNCSKVVLDGMVEAGQIHSDAAVTSLVLHKKRGPESRTCITVWEGKCP